MDAQCRVLTSYGSVSWAICCKQTISIGDDQRGIRGRCYFDSVQLIVGDRCLHARPSVRSQVVLNGGYGTWRRKVPDALLFGQDTRVRRSRYPSAKPYAISGSVPQKMQCTGPAGGGDVHQHSQTKARQVHPYALHPWRAW